MVETHKRIDERTQLPDSPKYQDEQWLIYRQALRDITNQVDPDNIIWPVKPEE